MGAFVRRIGQMLGCLALALLAGQAAAQTVTDGDSIKLNGTSYRLDAIDAPEIRQTCADGWPAGSESAQHLRSLMAGRRITCEHKSFDRYGRSVALCRADRQDLGAAMVRAGMAWAFVRYSRDYVELEDQARAQGLGVHARACEKAWEHRARVRAGR